MACFLVGPPIIYGMGTPTHHRKQRHKKTNFFWLHVFVRTYLEHWHHLLDVELHRCGQRSGHHCQQLTHVRTLAILFFGGAKK